jgi:DtxR family Mn-dependent transcriptional regulator
MQTILWIILFCAALALVIVLPRRLRAWYANRQRERVEDALKHLLDREQQGRHASVVSLAGTLDLPRTAMLKLLEDMETQSLVRTRGQELHLTSKGERWALHIVRAHRLWERYLADEARMPLEKVHGESDRREHNLTDAQLNALDAALGHPTRDPHGDPIPDAAGHFPAPQENTPLTAWSANRRGRIVHIEDEPPLAFAQITAEGLRLGQTIHILQVSPERYILTDGEKEYRLAPAVAANIFVEALPAEDAQRAGVIPLGELLFDQKAEIVTLDDACQGFTRRRFLDLGLTPGTKISPELQNFFGDPRGYRVRGTLIALRKDQAAQIWVKPA